MGDSSTFTVYLQTADDAQAVAVDVRTALAALQDVSLVDVAIEDVERSVEDVVQSITVTIITAGGVAGATTVFVEELTKLIKAIGSIRAAWRETDGGPVRIDLSDSDTPDKSDDEP